MSHAAQARTMVRLFRIALLAFFVTNLLSPWAAANVSAQDPGGYAPNSTITLQMPFIAGETWTVGGGGNFYGENTHSNANNDYYATDWNRTGDFQAPVLPVADGIVTAIRDRPCPIGPGTAFGCFVRIDHADGYRTLYGHLEDVFVITNTTVHTWDLIGLVGETGASEGVHLHLRFQRNGSSLCNTVSPPTSTTCFNGENLQAPQGHRPSPMMTASGPTTLVDAQTYTSVNGRVHLADLRNNYPGDGRITDIYVRNNGTVSRDATIYYFAGNGNPTPKVSDVCVLGPRAFCWILAYEDNRVPAGTLASAFVDGVENVTASAIHFKSGGIDSDNGFYPADIGDPAAQRTATTLYAAAVYNNIYNWNPSKFQVMNTGSSAASVTFTFKGRSGYNDYPAYTANNVPAKGLTLLDANTVVGSGPWVGSVIISSAQALAAKVTDTKPDGTTRTYNAAASGGTNPYVPAAYKTYFDFTTGLIVQNVGASSTSVELRFYDRPGVLIATHSLPNIDAQRAQGVNLANVTGLPNNWAGSVRIVNTTSPAQPLVAVSAADKLAGGSYFHSATGSPAGLMILTRVAKADGGRTTSYVVQNTSTTTSCAITAYYYDGGGVEVTSERETYTLAAYASDGRWQGNDTGLPDGWTGSIKLQASCGTLAAILREDYSSSISAHNGTLR